MSIATEFLKIAVRQLDTDLGRIENCVSRLTPEQVWARTSENSNAVGNLLLHLRGNVRQWILSGVGGAPDTRDRDGEFDARDSSEPSFALEELAATVRSAMEVIGMLREDQLLERVTVQGREVTKLDAVYTVTDHFTGHTFQIIFATKMLTGDDLGFYAHLRPAKTR